MIFGTTFSFKEYFRNLLPHYIIGIDSYKDSEGMGLFERYFVLFGENLDEEKAEQIENFLNIIDPKVCDSKFLNHISDSLGNPPDVFINDEQYRNLLYYIVSIYKIKGTKQAYALFFSILGFTIEIEEIPLLSPSSNYDLDITPYDTFELVDIYDQNVCQPCSSYTIKFYYTDNSEVLTLNTLGLLKNAIDFNEPINAHLHALAIVLNIEDSFSLDIVDTDPIITTELINSYDSGNTYDTETTSTFLNTENALRIITENNLNIII